MELWKIITVAVLAVLGILLFAVRWRAAMEVEYPHSPGSAVTAKSTKNICEFVLIVIAVIIWTLFVLPIPD